MTLPTYSSIPLETAKAARAVFGSSSVYLVIGDQANHLFDGLVLEDPAGQPGRPARILGLLYLVTIFQYIETLPDTQAVDALRERIDWKYALHLPLNYPGLEAATFCEFRKGAIRTKAGQQNLQTILQRLSKTPGLTSLIHPGLEARQVIATVCQISRLAKIWDTFNQALEALATRHPDWLLAVTLPHWYERYGSDQKYLNLIAGKPETYTLAQAIGADGDYLLGAISKANCPELANLSQVLAMREAWEEQYKCVQGKVAWRKEACTDCSSSDIYPNLIQSENQHI